MSSLKSLINKSFRKSCCVLLALLLTLGFSGCGKSKEKKQSEAVDNVLYTKGCDIVRTISQMLKNDSYEALTSTSGMEEVVNSLKICDYSKPSKVFEVRFNKDYFAYLVENGDAKFQDMPEELRTYVEQRTKTQFTTVLNSRFAGVSAVAACGIYQASKSFVCKDLEEDTIYMYIFESGYPIIVTFIKGEDGAVSATGSILISDSFHMDNAEDVKKQLEAQYFINDVTVKEVHYSGEK